jgi:acetyl esterase/lipase
MTYAFDPELAAVIPLMPMLDHTDLPAARAQITNGLGAMPVPDATGVEVGEVRVPGPRGAPEVVLRTYRPQGVAGLLPVVYDMHGGGFTVGSVDIDHAANLAFSRDLGALVVSVEYRLAPEDCYAGLSWVARNAAELDADPDRIVVHGASAGGGLAALPPAYVAVMEFDPLRDEGIGYARALLAAGVPTELHLFPGTFHGSAVAAYAGISQRENAEAHTVLRRALSY